MALSLSLGVSVRILAVIALLILGSGWCAAATVRGQLVNGTTGERGRADSVQLMDLSAGFVPVATLTDVSGPFEIDVPAGNQSTAFIVQARVGSTVYSVRWDGQSTDAIEITLYDAAPDVAIEAEVGVLAIFAYESSVDLGAFYNLDNNSSPARVLDNPEGTFRYRVSPGYRNLDIATRYGSNMPLRQAAPEPGAEGVLHYPLKPGRTQLIVTATHDYRREGSEYEVPVPANQDELRMLVVPSSLQISGPGVEFLSRETDEDIAIYLWSREQGQSSVALRISGTPAPSRNLQGAQTDEAPMPNLQNPERVPDRISRYRWWVVAAVVVLCGSVGLVGRRQARARA